MRAATAVAFAGLAALAGVGAWWVLTPPRPGPIVAIDRPPTAQPAPRVATAPSSSAPRTRAGSADDAHADEPAPAGIPRPHPPPGDPGPGAVGSDRAAAMQELEVHLADAVDRWATEAGVDGATADAVSTRTLEMAGALYDLVEAQERGEIGREAMRARLQEVMDAHERDVSAMLRASDLEDFGDVMRAVRFPNVPELPLP